MNDTPTPTPRQKSKKNKIRPKLKPIVSTHEDDDDGVLGYGEWAPSPLKPRQTPENNNWSGSEEDEKKEGDTIDEINKMSPKCQPASTTERELTKEEEVQSNARLDEVVTSRPTQSQRCFDNKLQLSESNTDGEIEKVSNTSTSSTNTYAQQAEVSDIENILSDGNLQMLRSRIWKGFILLLCIAISCEVLSIAIIAKVRLSHHVELSSDENEAWVPDKEPTIEETGVDEVLQSSGEEKDQLPNMERVELEEGNEYDEAELGIDSTSEAAVVNEEQYDTNNDGGSAIEVQDNELLKLNEEATESDEQPIKTSSSESSEDNDEQPSTQEGEGPASIEQASDFRLNSEENLSISEEVTANVLQMMQVRIHLDANGTLNLSDDEVSQGKLDAIEQAEEVLPVEATEEVREKFESIDEQSRAKQDEVLSMHEVLESAMSELPEPEENLPSVEEEHENIERNDDQPNTQEDKGSESISNEISEADSSKLGVEQERYSSPSEEALINETTVQNISLVIDEELDANSTVDSSGNGGFGDEIDEQADTDLVEIQDFDKHEQPELVVSDEYDRDSLSVMKEITVEDEQPATNIHDAGNATIPSTDAESVENKHAQTELIEKDRISENGSDQSKLEGSPSLDNNTHDDNDQEEKEDVHQQVILPRTVETKREYLASLQKFEDVFEPHEVIDALIGHVVCVLPRLLLKGILGAAMKIKRRFSKKKQ